MKNNTTHTTKKNTTKPKKSVAKADNRKNQTQYGGVSAVKTIGILGGGQLGMMLAEAALPLGFDCVFLEDAPHCPASKYGTVYTTDKLNDFIHHADVFTLEFENTPVATVEMLEHLSSAQNNDNELSDDEASTNANRAKKSGMFPPAIALQIAQDRLAEKSLFNDLNIATVPFMAVSSKEELSSACTELGLPLVLKTSRGGYDGKGQFVIRSADDVAQAWSELGGAVTGAGSLTATPAPLIAESFISFSREVSIIAVRDQIGTIQSYELVENHHHKGILATTKAPAVGTNHLKVAANEAISKLLTHLHYVGVMALELFICKNADGEEIILANEIAPRVHNSGHWSIEGAVTSQFENHIRAVTGLPLGDTSNVHPSIMVNVLGEYPQLADVLSIKGAHYHSYHKEERENRKIAHITLMPNDPTELADSLTELLTLLPNKVGLT